MTLISYNHVVFLYRARNNLLPEILCGLFVTNSSVHSHDTHQKDINCTGYRFRLIVRQYSIKIYGVKLWNLLSEYIIESPTYLIQEALQGVPLRHSD